MTTTVKNFINEFKEKNNCPKCPICGCEEFTIGGESDGKKEFIIHVYCGNPICRINLTYEFDETRESLSSKTENDINLVSYLHRKILALNKDVQRKTGTDMLGIQGFILNKKTGY